MIGLGRQCSGGRRIRSGCVKLSQHYHLTVPAATVGARNLMGGSKGACVVRDRRGGSAGGDGEEETDSSCVLTAEVVVRCTPVIGRGVG